MDLLTILFIVIAVWMFLIAPNVMHPKRDFSAFSSFLFAHRGLHDDRIPENSLAAFDKAAQMGFGIELDVHLTKDHQLVVMHDSALERMCGDPGIIEEKTLDELSPLRLSNTQERIPTLHEVLELVDGRVPLIIEMKGTALSRDLPAALDQQMASYKGVYCVESFNPFYLLWMRRNRPDIVRGQLAGNIGAKYPLEKLLQFALKSLLVNVLSRPDFIAYDANVTRNMSKNICHKIYRPWWVAWTVKTPEQLAAIQPHYDALIFEGFIPQNERSSRP